MVDMIGTQKEYIPWIGFGYFQVLTRGLILVGMYGDIVIHMKLSKSWFDFY